MAKAIQHKFKAGERVVTNPSLLHMSYWDADRVFVIAKRLNRTNSRDIPLYRIKGDRVIWSEEWFVSAPLETEQQS